MSIPSPKENVVKEQVLAKMQELDTALQAAVRVRTELWSMLSILSDDRFFAEIKIPLTFYEGGNVIFWGSGSESFTPSTFRLVKQLWFAPDCTLSKDGVRQEVIEDKHASEESIWTCVKRARQELEALDFPYEIETLHGKGYRLTQMS